MLSEKDFYAGSQSDTLPKATRPSGVRLNDCRARELEKPFRASAALWRLRLWLGPRPLCAPCGRVGWETPAYFPPACAPQAFMPSSVTTHLWPNQTPFRQLSVQNNLGHPVSQAACPWIDPWGPSRSCLPQWAGRRLGHESYLQLVQVRVLLAPGLLELHEVRGALVELHQQHLEDRGPVEPPRPAFPHQALGIQQRATPWGAPGPIQHTRATQGPKTDHGGAPPEGNEGGTGDCEFVPPPPCIASSQAIADRQYHGDLLAVFKMAVGTWALKTFIWHRRKALTCLHLDKWGHMQRHEASSGTARGGGDDRWARTWDWRGSPSPGHSATLSPALSPQASWGPKAPPSPLWGPAHPTLLGVSSPSHARCH